MKYRFFAPTIAEITTLTGEEFHHAVRVVRVRQGEEVELFDGNGEIVVARVETIGPDHLILHTTGAVGDSRESPLVLHLGMAIINLDRFEIVLQKATELGVRSIIPVVSERVEIRAERYRGKRERWEKIVFEAVKQSGRGRVPILEEPAPFAEVIKREGTSLVFDGDMPPGSLPAQLPEATLFVGPEGGWSESEHAQAREQGAIFQRLGPRRLRAETAAIVACTIVATRFGDL
jgi:16S rRNA (uracil1498-N3)-methyltransferase